MKYNAMPAIDCSSLDAVQFISSRAIIFWDFDGVIKDSVHVKTEAFAQLFSAYGLDIVGRVKSHHEANGGMSRYEKIPIYLKWAGLSCDKDRVDQFCALFAELVTETVIDAPWVPGVKEYLLDHCELQYFVLVTATPQPEIEVILDRLGIAQCFRRVYGAPMRKTDAIAKVLSAKHADLSDMLMIGDSEADLLAAETNCVPFLLRRTRLNRLLPSSYGLPQFEDLL